MISSSGQHSLELLKFRPYAEKHNCGNQLVIIPPPITATPSNTILDTRAKQTYLECKHRGTYRQDTCMSKA